MNFNLSENTLIFIYLILICNYYCLSNKLIINSIFGIDIYFNFNNIFLHLIYFIIYVEFILHEYVSI